MINTIRKVFIHSIEKTLSYVKYKPLTMRPNGFMGRYVITKDCSLATDVDCSELHVVFEAVQAPLKVANLTE